MSHLRHWPHSVEMDDEIRAAMPSNYVKYDVTIVDAATCDVFVILNGSEWRKCAKLILAKLRAQKR